MPSCMGSTKRIVEPMGAEADSTIPGNRRIGGSSGTGVGWGVAMGADVGSIVGTGVGVGFAVGSLVVGALVWIVDGHFCVCGKENVQTFAFCRPNIEAS